MAPTKALCCQSHGEGGGQILVEVCVRLAAMEIDICARVCLEPHSLARNGGGGGGAGKPSKCSQRKSDERNG